MRHKIDPNKQATTNIPRWVHKLENYKPNKALNIESDRTLFAFIILYAPTRVNNITLFNELNVSTYIGRLYNWKYTS
jgi:hypothetical protein